jgi:predicted transcriptional regulator
MRQSTHKIAGQHDFARLSSAPMTGTELLVALRELGMSQKAFAARAGIRQEAISRYVRGHVPVPPYVVMAIDSLKNTEAAQ